MTLQERSPPCVDDFLYICDDAYKREELISMEASILQTLRFDINIPIPYRFLRRYAKVRIRAWRWQFRAVCLSGCDGSAECLLCCCCSVWARAWTRWLWPGTTARWAWWRWSWCRRGARCWPPPACWWRWPPKTWEDGWVWTQQTHVFFHFILSFNSYVFCHFCSLILDVLTVVHLVSDVRVNSHVKCQ